MPLKTAATSNRTRRPPRYSRPGVRHRTGVPSPARGARDRTGGRHRPGGDHRARGAEAGPPSRAQSPRIELLWRARGQADFGLGSGRSPMTIRTAFLATAFIGSHLLAAADAPVAANLLRWSGRDRGVALVADGSGVAPALVAASSLVVVDQQPDEARRMAAAQAADKAGTLGRRLYVAIGSPETCVLADGYADLVVQAAATDKTLTPETTGELARVVAPYGGTLVVGNPGGASSGLTRAALTAWATKLGEKVAIKTGGGLWAVWKRPALPGGDDWSHWYYDASANPVSRDTALTYPFELAWTAKPMHTARTQTRAAADGRLFTITRPHQKEGMFQTHRFEGGNEVIARSLANGELLWRYDLGDDAYTERSTLIATPGAVYVMRREKVLVFDPQTGEGRAPICPVKEPGEVKSIWLRDGVLVALTGPTRDEPQWSSTANTGASGKKLTQALMAGTFGYGDALAGWDVKAGTERWRWTAPLIDHRMCGIGPDGLVVAYAKDKEVVGLNLADGKVRWQQTDPAVIGELAKFQLMVQYADVDFFSNSTGMPGVVITGEIALLSHSQAQTKVALSPKDGSLLWTAPVPRGYCDPNICLTPQLPIIKNAGPKGTGSYVDLKTGQPLALEKGRSPDGFGGGLCSQPTATPRYLLSTQGGAVWDLEKGRPLMPSMIKTECGRGSFAADGTLVAVAGACSQCEKIYGSLALRSFSHLDLRNPPPAAQRLIAGTGKAVASAEDAKDWFTARHDARRSGASPVTLPAQAAIRWRWTPPTPYPVVGDNVYNLLSIDAEHRLTQPVGAGNLVAVAGSEGAVTGIDRATGKQLWRAVMGGRVISSPTINGGRVFVGCTDGTVTALAAADGALLWRYRLAPYERRVMSYGFLQSQWPATSSPLVADGAVYVAAGHPASSGGYIVALDAATGDVRWERKFVPWSGDDYPNPDDKERLKDPNKLWLAPYGAMALDGGRLVVKLRDSAGPLGLVLDRRTGEQAVPTQPLFDASRRPYGESPGSETTILPDGMVLGGGYYLDRDQNRMGFISKQGVAAAVVDANGEVRTGPVRAENGWQSSFMFLPCWNEKLLVLPGFGAFGLEAYDRAAWQAEVAPKLLKRPPYGFEVKVNLQPQWGPIAPDTGEAVKNGWMKVGNQVMAVALAEDAVLATSLKKAPMPDGPFKGESFKLAKIVGGQATAFDAGTGALRWTVELPAPPAGDALALDRDGNALIGLQDGSVVCVGIR